MSIVWAIALNTWRQFVRDKIFYLVLLVALLMLGFSYFLATLTIVESRKILLDFSLSAASLAGALMGIYLGVVAVAREIENRTIYTVITKPVSRSGYLTGKLLGCFFVLAVAQILLGISIRFILFTASEAVPAGFYSCLLLMLMENTILLGVASFFSVFTSSILAAGFSLAFFLIGRSNGTLLMMSEKANTGEVRAVARFLYFLFPNLERYNIRDLVAYERPFPESLLWIGLAYLAGYLLFSLGAACVLFHRRDMP
jgi:Cu-processing system permease protein